MSNPTGFQPQDSASSPAAAPSRMGRPVGMEDRNFDAMMDSQESLKEQRKSQQRVSFKEPLKTGKHAWFDMIDQIQDQYSHMPRESEFRGSRNDLPRIRQSLKLQKTELIQEVKKEDDSRNLFATLKVITQYLIQEQTKKARAFKIGIFTVFIVVMVITMLKSVVASSPLVFVKIG